MLIGLSGKRGAGKDTVAAALVADYGFTRFAFADVLKNMLREINPLVPAFGGLVPLDSIVAVHGWDVAKADPIVRRLLQTTGRAITDRNPRFFARTVWAHVDACPRDVVITDMRFGWELDGLRERAGFLVRIERIGHVVDDQDSSETEADNWPFDVILDNRPGTTDPAYLAHLLLEEIRFFGT